MTAASTKNCRLEFSRPLLHSDDCEQLWNKHNIKLVTKCKVYRAIILSCLLYSSETYTLYRRHIQRLSQIHLRHLQAILGIRWSDRVTNNEVLQRADMPRIEAMLLSQHLTWTSNIVRMNDDRLPKAVLYGELWQAKQNFGRPHVTWTAQSDTSMPPISTRGTGRRWRTITVHGIHTAIKKGATKAKTKTATDAEIKRQCRHECALALVNQTNQQPALACQ